MSYLSLSDKDKTEMLARAGVGAVDDLFCCIPEAVRLKRPLDLPPAQSELELVRTVDAIGAKNSGAGLLTFLGGGAYEHFIPTVVDYLSSRGEFVSPYTPYQPEVSQGTLQTIFEFQTLVCQLTGLDIANASLYDGSTGTAEAVLMAERVTGRNKVLIARSLHPQYREVVRTYIKNLGFEAVEVGFGPDGRIDREALGRLLDDTIGAVVCQSPNFFGVIEDVQALSDAAHARKALSVVVVAEALSLGLLEAPGKLGADIVTGEGQSLGIPVSFGGPYLGFMACKKDFLRQMPGRIAGQTVDKDGRRGFVLTLSTREQHIRRERATSNICTNQALCALRATIFMETLGKQGMRELAWLNAQKAAYAAEALGAVPGVKRRLTGPVFNEFVLELARPWPGIDAALRGKGIIGGYGLGTDYPELKNAVLVAVTELRTQGEIDRLARTLREVLS
ncbi:MAG TPA: aminomethyl-transferring glycine dehydrogenase subunit GcvPA [Acidobacteriota bacterium]|nr:aminomethyl-transferring glycine dehydrogenase subunit GcvPA [Acidobacteriota bacterium]